MAVFIVSLSDPLAYLQSLFIDRSKIKTSHHNNYYYGTMRLTYGHICLF